MVNRLEQHSTNVVVLGDFNPALFQPFWFSSNDLIKKSEVEAAKVEIISSEVTVFTAEWLQVKVFKDRFQVGTQQGSMFGLLRDLLIDTFSFLDKSPIRAFGINNDFIVSFDSEKEWNDFGHTIIPPANWDGILVKPGMLEAIEQSPRPDSYKGYVKIKLAPTLVRETVRAVSFDQNDHFNLADNNDIAMGSKLVDLLKTEWKNIQTSALKNAQRMLNFKSMEIIE